MIARLFVIIAIISPAGFAANLLNVPLSFEGNQDQFISRGPGYSLFLGVGEVVLNLERGEPASLDTLRMRLIGSNPKAVGNALERQPGVVSYFIGNDPKKWRTAIPTYGRIRYSRIYPGIDLIFYGNQRRLEYDLVIAPGADPSRIAWRIDGARVRLDAHGNLILAAPDGVAMFEKPVLYQRDRDRKTPVEGEFALASNQVRFRVGAYDHSRPLIIDPVLSYATYLGGSNMDNIGNSTGPGILQVGASQALAIDSAGSAYVTGYTQSVDFPVENPYQGTQPSKTGGFPYRSVFVTKFSPDGSSLVYSTYLGGDATDFAYAIAVDASGSAYVTGETYSVNFPITTGVYQTVCSPQPNTKSASLNAAPAACNSSNNSAFVTKLSPAGTSLVYSTFLGGFGAAYGTGIAVDSAGRAYVVGFEDAPCNTSYLYQGCFPTTSGAIISTLAANNVTTYCFAAVFDPNGANLLYSTLFGDLNGLKTSTTVTSGGTLATGVTVDSNGYFYLVGETQAGKLPTTAGVVQQSATPLDTTASYVTAYRGFIAKFNPITSGASLNASLNYATYLGGQTGNTSDYISGIAIDSAGNSYVAGYTNSNDFPVTAGAFGTVCGLGGTCAAAHVTKLNPSASQILWSTYVGGSKQDGSDDVFFTGPIQLDGNGNVYILAQNNGGQGFPMVNPVEATATGGDQQVLVVELDPTGSKLLFSSTIGSDGLNTTSPAGLAVDAGGDIFLAGNTNGPNLITTPSAFQPNSTDGPCCGLGNGFVAKIAASPVPAITSVQNAFGGSATIAPNTWVKIMGSNLAPTGDSRTWQSSDFTGGVMPTALDGVSATVNGKSAYVEYISSSQVNILAPPDTMSGAVNVVLTNGTVNASFTTQAAALSPSFFVFDGTHVVAQHLNYSDVGPTTLYPGLTTPAAPGEEVLLYANGFGSTTVPVVSGSVTQGGTLATLPVVTIGGLSATVIYAGLLGPGEFQFNVIVPEGAPNGDLPLTATYAGLSTQNGVVITVQQ